MRIVPKLAHLRALLEGADDRGAALGLNRDHARAFCIVEPAQRFELGEGLPHPDQAGSAAGGIKDHIRQLPIEGLGQLVSHHFFAFDAVRLLERRHIEPAFTARFFSRPFGRIADQAVHKLYARADNAALFQVGERCIFRHDDEGPESGARRVGRHCAAGVACGGNNDFV